MLDPTSEASVSDPLTPMTARATVFLTAVRTPFASIPLGIFAGLVTAPMWLSSLRRYRGALLLTLAIIVATVWGIVLTEIQAPFNGGTSSQTLLSFSFLPIYILTGTGALLWAREHLSETTVGIMSGLGILVTNIMNRAVLSPENPWKFGIALPVTIIALSVVAGSERWQPTVATLAILGSANALLDSRSAVAICALSMLLFVAQRQWSKHSGGSVRARAFSLLLLAVTASAVLYQVISYLLMAGYLGEEAQQRSIAQVDLSGNMIVGGRPEMAATWALMKHRPAGFGTGGYASTEDVMVAKTGMWGINYQPDNGYVENYMFGGGRITLHSVIGDMWAYFGIVGIALAFIITTLLVHALFVRLATGNTSGLRIFLTCTALWNIPFGPLWGTTPILAVTLGLLLLPRDGLVSARAIISKRRRYWTS